jgi:hypothetical protein
MAACPILEGMTMQYQFLNPDLFRRIDRKVDAILAAFPDTSAQRWQVEEMVGAIEVKACKKTAYVGDGIVVDGWNGYLSYPDLQSNPDPSHAWGGFYRLESGQMAGTTVRYVRHALETGGEDAAREQLSRCRLAYHVAYNLEFEPVNRIWGYRVYEEFYTEQEAQDHAARIQAQPGYKRHSLTFSEMSGMFRVRWETSRKPAHLSGWHLTRCRINRDGSEMTNN